MATFHVMQGADKGRTLKSNDTEILLGRGSSQVPLTDQTVSRRHAEMTCTDGIWRIRDLNSANGTFVNGQRISAPTRLKSGDQIKLGSTLLMYSGDDTIESLSGSNIPQDLVTLEPAHERVDSAVLATIPTAEDSIVLSAPDTAYAVKSWRAVRELTDVIGSLLTVERLLQRLMDIVFEQVPADRGVVFIRDEDTKELLPSVVRFRSRKARAEATRRAITASRAIVDHVVGTHEGVLCSNVVSDERFKDGDAQELGSRSVICAPIVARDQVLGVIHLDCPTHDHVYNEYELRLITALGYQTGLAIENAHLVQSHLERERLAAAGETVAYLSHSIKNILQGMRAGGDVVQRGLDRRDFDVASKGWRILDRNLDKVYRLMLNMLAFSKQREPQVEMLFLRKIIEDVLELVHEQADENEVAIDAEFDDSQPPIPVDYDGVHQTLLNLLSNALDAVPRGTGQIRVKTDYDADNRRVLITIADNGPGITLAQREKIFEPFHSTKGQGGTGLGLAVARKNVVELGGSVEVRESSMGGAEFVIELPTAEARRAAPGETQGPV